MAQQWPTTAPSVSPGTHDPVATQAYMAGGGDYFRSGYYHFPLPSAATAAAGALVTSRLYFVPLLVPVRRAFDRIGVNVTIGAASSSIRMGIYSSSGGPSALVLDAGTVASTAATAAEITISQTLDPGLWWLAYVGQGGSPTVTQYAAATVSPFVGAGTAPLSTMATGNCYYSSTTVAGALPSTAGTLNAWQTAAVIGLRAA